MASECEIVSRGAAYVFPFGSSQSIPARTLTTYRAKRYERLMKAHGIATPGGANDESPAKKTPSPKKRKVVAEAEDDLETPTRGKKNVKTEAMKNEGANDEGIQKHSA